MFDLPERISLSLMYDQPGDQMSFITWPSECRNTAGIVLPPFTPRGMSVPPNASLETTRR